MCGHLVPLATVLAFLFCWFVLFVLKRVCISMDVFAQFSDDPALLEETVGNYLGPLLDFAREVLRDKEDEWHTYPIYLKATGGLRTLPQPQRVQLLDCVRKLFHNTTFNPFDFEDERARVISGEEEAIYGWVGVNFGAYATSLCRVTVF